MISVKAILEPTRLKIMEPEKVEKFRKTLPVGSYVEITLRKWEDGRSLRANALFHELVGRYAAEQGTAFDVVKINFKQYYGVWVPAGDAMTDPPKWNGRLIDYFGDLLYFKSTADYTIREFNELTKGALAECHDSGVNIEDIMANQNKV